MTDRGERADPPARSPAPPRPEGRGAGASAGVGSAAGRQPGYLISIL